MTTTAGDLTTHYFLGIAEYEAGTGWTKMFVRAERRKIAEHRSGITRFFHDNHLGTPPVETTVECRDFFTGSKAAFELEEYWNSDRIKYGDLGPPRVLAWNAPLQDLEASHIGFSTMLLQTPRKS